MQQLNDPRDALRRDQGHKTRSAPQRAPSRAVNPQISGHFASFWRTPLSTRSVSPALPARLLDIAAFDPGGYPCESPPPFEQFTQESCATQIRYPSGVPSSRRRQTLALPNSARCGPYRRLGAANLAPPHPPPAAPKSVSTPPPPGVLTKVQRVPRHGGAVTGTSSAPRHSIRLGVGKYRATEPEPSGSAPRDPFPQPPRDPPTRPGSQGPRSPPLSYPSVVRRLFILKSIPPAPPLFASLTLPRPLPINAPRFDPDAAAQRGAIAILGHPPSSLSKTPQTTPRPSQFHHDPKRFPEVTATA